MRLTPIQENFPTSLFNTEHPRIHAFGDVIPSRSQLGDIMSSMVEREREKTESSAAVESPKSVRKGERGKVPHTAGIARPRETLLIVRDGIPARLCSLGRDTGVLASLPSGCRRAKESESVLDRRETLRRPWRSPERCSRRPEEFASFARTLLKPPLRSAAAAAAACGAHCRVSPWARASSRGRAPPSRPRALIIG